MYTHSCVTFNASKTRSELYAFEPRRVLQNACLCLFLTRTHTHTHNIYTYSSHVALMLRVDGQTCTYVEYFVRTKMTGGLGAQWKNESDFPVAVHSCQHIHTQYIPRVRHNSVCVCQDTQTHTGCWVHVCHCRKL